MCSADSTTGHYVIWIVGLFCAILTSSWTVCRRCVWHTWTLSPLLMTSRFHSLSAVTRTVWHKAYAVITKFKPRIRKSDFKMFPIFSKVPRTQCTFEEVLRWDEISVLPGFTCRFLTCRTVCSEAVFSPCKMSWKKFRMNYIYPSEPHCDLHVLPGERMNHGCNRSLNDFQPTPPVYYDSGICQ
jgi:hypothetical protein